MAGHQWQIWAYKVCHLFGGCNFCESNFLHKSFTIIFFNNWEVNVVDKKNKKRKPWSWSWLGQTNLLIGGNFHIILNFSGQIVFERVFKDFPYVSFNQLLLIKQQKLYLVECSFNKNQIFIYWGCFPLKKYFLSNIFLEEDIRILYFYLFPCEIQLTIGRCSNTELNFPT